MEHAVITLQAKAGFQPMLSIDACHPPGFLQGKRTLHWSAELPPSLLLCCQGDRAAAPATHPAVNVYRAANGGCIAEETQTCAQPEQEARACRR